MSRITSRLRRLWAWYEKLWPKHVISESEAKQAEDAQYELEHARKTIHSHKFLEHMALGKLETLRQWREDVQPQLVKELYPEKHHE